MKIVPKRKLHYPFALECDYTKLLTSYVKDCMTLVRNYIPEMRKLVTEQSERGATSVNVYLDLLIDRIRHDMPQAEATEGRMRRFFDDVAHFTWRDLKRLLESVTGTQISDRGARLPRKDGDDDLDALKELWVGENLDLIRSIDDETMRRIRQALIARITGSVNHAGLAKDLVAEIQAITEKEKNRAELIARDQLGKLHGQINRRKQESLGIDEYEWETSHDERVRDSHRALQGKVFSWSKPPPEGHPGYPIRCRCIALPVIDWDRQLGEPQKGSYEEVKSHEVKPSETDKLFKETSESDIIKARKAVEAAFASARTIKEAENFARTVLGIPQVSYKGLDIAVANAWNEGLQDTFNRFPELKKSFGFVGEVHARNAGIKQSLKAEYLKELKKKYPKYSHGTLEGFAEKWARKDMLRLRIGKRTLAQSCFSDDPLFAPYRGICVNREVGRNATEFGKILSECVGNKFHPVGCDTIRSVLDHEVGHQLDHMLGIRDMQHIKDLFDKRTNFELSKAISRYSWENTSPDRYSEMIAEAWAEYCNNPNPREIARVVGKTIEEEYKKKFGIK